MGFYVFRQSNPGGYYLNDDRTPRTARYVLVEACCAEKANAIAEEHRIYFDGIDQGYDCECCNDRWKRASERDRVDRKYITKPLDEDMFYNPKTVAIIYADGEIDWRRN